MKHLTRRRPTQYFAFLTLAVLFIHLATSVSAYAQKSEAQDSASLDPIKWSGNGLKLEMQPLSHDLVHAFFLGRGFSKKDTDFLAQEGCVFRSAIGHASTNRSDPPITIELEKWLVEIDGKTHPMRTREAWKEIWEKRKIDETAKIAFHWALFPTTQTYQPSDYNWGLLTFAQKPGTKFDLILAWREGNTPRSHRLSGLKCGQ